MSQLEKLKTCENIQDFADLLGYRPAALSYILFKMPAASKYRQFTIPKKSGGVRIISAPNDHLKEVQKRLAGLLAQCVAEHAKNSSFKHTLSHAYKAGFSIATNARPHTNRRFVLNIDLANFFPTLNFGRVRGFFIKDNRFILKPAIATLVAQIACHENALPQGSPCSPIISDLIGSILDMRLVRVAKKTGCTYTRYADDITFSTNQRQFPKAIASKVSGSECKWVLSKQLLEKVGRCGFEVNPKKTRMQYNNSRQVVTGLTVNTGVNIRQDFYRASRVMCDKIFKTGAFEVRPKGVACNIRRSILSKAVGYIVLWVIKWLQLYPVATEIGAEQQGVPLTLKVLNGRLNHIYLIKQFNAVTKSSGKSDAVPLATFKLYRKFLHYEKFLANEKPLIACEGVTDNIYLKCALRSRYGGFPLLAEMTPKGVSFKIRFFNYTKTAKNILDLGGGVSFLNSFIAQYSNNRKQYNVMPTHPVIILVDDDSGGATTKHTLKNLGKYNPTAPFQYCGDNLYVIFTPPNPKDPAATQSAIEDFFPDAVLATQLDGRTFNRSNTEATSTEYTKFEFAEKVVRRKQSEINFAYFDALFALIGVVINDYAFKRAALLAS